MNCPHTDRPVRSKGMCSSCYMKQVPSRSREARRAQHTIFCKRNMILSDCPVSEKTDAYKHLIRSTTVPENTGHVTAMARALSGEKVDRKDGGVHQIHRTMRVHVECLSWALNLQNTSLSVLDPCAGSGQILEVFKNMGFTSMFSNDLNFDGPEWYSASGVTHTKYDIFGPSKHIPKADFVVCSPPYIVCEYVMKRLVQDRKARIAYMFHTTTDFLTNASFVRREWWDEYELDKKTTLRIEGLPVNTCEGANRDEATVQQRRNTWCIIFTSKRYKHEFTKLNSNIVSFYRLNTSLRRSTIAS